MTTLTQQARQLILDHEGLDQPSRHPGGDSGITLPFGYDLGYTTIDRFRADWRDELSAQALDRLSRVVGRKGEAAARRADEFRDIRISIEAAMRVFERSTVPRTFAACRRAFKGFDALPPDVQGVLVSLVFNRGTSMGVQGKPSWESRREMRLVRNAVAAGDIREIAVQIRAMQRLWKGKGLDGLIRRREGEAALVESAIEERA